MAVPPETRCIDRAAAFVRRHILWLLVACYVLAAFVPAPGVAVRGWQWSSTEFAKTPLVSLLLLAVLLFVAAILTDVKQLRVVSHHPFVLLAALAAVWIGPALLVLAVNWLMPSAVGGQSSAGLLVAIALVASMPVANSSVGWTQSADGNLGLGLALVVGSILLSPWIAPYLLGFFGRSLVESRPAIEALVNQFSGVFFIVWVILPTAAGFAVRLLLTGERIDRARGCFTLASAAALLALNYLNSVLALPKAYGSPASLLAATAILATSLAAIGILLGWGIAALFRLRPETRTALLFGLSMKHTGLALILAGAVLNDQPLAILLIVLATLMQHLLAGVVEWFVVRAEPSA
jgi:BASS family bile acid:Na+ symporter